VSVMIVLRDQVMNSVEKRHEKEKAENRKEESGYEGYFFTVWLVEGKVKDVVVKFWPMKMRHVIDLEEVR